MSLFNPDDTSENEDKQIDGTPIFKEDPIEVPTATSVTKNTSTTSVNNKVTPTSSLLTEVEGFPWTVDFFFQLLGDRDAPQSFSPTLDPTLQQYHRIKNLELRVQDALNYTYVDDRSSNYLQGSAIVIAGLPIPNKGDLFIAEVGDGRKAFFTLTNVRPLSYMMERCYEIEYSTRGLGIVDDYNYDSLISKVVKTSFFEKDFLNHGQNPVVSEADVVTRDKLDKIGSRILDLYGRSFISPENRYLLLPEQPIPTFDFFVSEMVHKLIDTSRFEAFRNANWGQLPYSNITPKKTLWDVLLDDEPVSHEYMKNFVQHEIMFVDTVQFKVAPWFTSLYYSNIGRIAWPLEPCGFSSNGSVNRYKSPFSFHTRLQAVESDLQYFADMSVCSFENANRILDEIDLKDCIGETCGKVTDDIIVPECNELDDNSNEYGDDGLEGIAEKAIPDVYPVTYDPYYVLSEHFYSGNRPKQSLLELLTTRMVRNEQIPSGILHDLCEKSFSWQPMERFYYSPILLMLIRYVIRRM